MFHRLRLIESYGTGIRRIYKLYENCPVQPAIEATPNAFKMVLPNMNAVADEAIKPETGITPQMKKVLDHISEHGQITDEAIRSLLGIKKTRAFDIMKQMRNMGLVRVVGRGADKQYLLK